MALTKGLASKGLQTVSSVAFETAYDASTDGPPQEQFEVFAQGTDINVRATPNHQRPIGTALDYDVVPAGSSQVFRRVAPNGQGLVSKLELQAAALGGQARWTT